MDDTRLIELAGLAAGEQYTAEANPLIRDDLAFRLGLKLKMLFGAGDCECCATAIYGGEDDEVRVRFSAEFNDREADDLLSATRRAIVRAAAEIGKGAAK